MAYAILGKKNPPQQAKTKLNHYQKSPKQTHKTGNRETNTVMLRLPSIKINKIASVSES